MLPGNRCLSKLQTHRQPLGLCAVAGLGAWMHQESVAQTCRNETSSPVGEIRRAAPRPHGGRLHPGPHWPAQSRPGSLTPKTRVSWSRDRPGTQGWRGTPRPSWDSKVTLGPLCFLQCILVHLHLFFLPRDVPQGGSCLQRADEGKLEVLHSAKTSSPLWAAQAAAPRSSPPGPFLSRPETRSPAWR